MVGTQALIQEGVDLSSVRVVVIDEQHRFGVRQRAALMTPQPGLPWPHTLHMTATPIPRTLSLTLYGDLDVSVIDELPPGRTPVNTRPWSQGDVSSSGSSCAKAGEGRQTYVVCPLVEESDSLQAASAVATYEELAAGPLRGLRLGLIHGQMKSEHKHEVMRAFERADYDVLVTTTVIEVGVDVPNATVMVIEDARRFGLSQLHQLRGRVARGTETGHCLVGADGCDEDALKRLDLFCRTTDGFELAEADLRARGEGQVFGERQSGWGDLKVARLLRDQRLLMDARDEASADACELPDSSDSRARAAARRGRRTIRRFDGLVGRCRESSGNCASSPARTRAAGSVCRAPTTVRPTADRVREAVFSTLGDVGGTEVLDLFAGVGCARPGSALPRCRRTAPSSNRTGRWPPSCETTWLRWGSRPGSKILQTGHESALSRLMQRGARFDLLFMDPP